MELEELILKYLWKNKRKIFQEKKNTKQKMKEDYSYQALKHNAKFL